MKENNSDDKSSENNNENNANYFDMNISSINKSSSPVIIIF